MYQTPCKHCGKDKGKHLAKTFHCPLPSRSQWKQFSTTETYEAREPTKRDIEKSLALLKFQL